MGEDDGSARRARRYVEEGLEPAGWASQIMNGWH
jgi:hypothetical protein